MNAHSKNTLRFCNINDTCYSIMKLHVMNAIEDIVKFPIKLPASALLLSMDSN